MKVNLPPQQDTIEFFKKLKRLSNRYWAIHGIDDNIYGYEMQGKVQWKPGLSDEELKDFEEAMGFSFPAPLRNFYKTMNGLTKQGVSYDEHGTAYYFPFFYSYPDDLALIQKNIDWIYKATSMTEERRREEGISRIFPITAHRCIMIDTPSHPILSMHGNDIIFWSTNLSQLVALDVLPGAGFKKGFDRYANRIEVTFWLDLENSWHKAREAKIPENLSKGETLRARFCKPYKNGEYSYRLTLACYEDVYKLTMMKVFVNRKGNSDGNWILEGELQFADYEILQQYVQSELSISMCKFY